MRIYICASNANEVLTKTSWRPVFFTFLHSVVSNRLQLDWHQLLTFEPANNTHTHTHINTHTHTNMHACTHTSTHIHTQWKPKHIGGQILSVLGQDFPSYSVSLKESPSRHQENSILGFRPGSRKSSLVVESPEKETTAWPTIHQS